MSQKTFEDYLKATPAERRKMNMNEILGEERLANIRKEMLNEIKDTLQEDKELLLKDLCARLPYHDLWVQYYNKDWLAIGYGHERIELLPSIFSSISGPCPLIDEIKPYLRPMSSMTEEEREELSHCENSVQRTDFFYAHHIDCRFLIEKGLALEASEDMYKTE